MYILQAGHSIKRTQSFKTTLAAKGNSTACTGAQATRIQLLQQSHSLTGKKLQLERSRYNLAAITFCINIATSLIMLTLAA